MAVAGSFIEELLVNVRYVGTLARALERHRHERDPLRRALPCPAEDEPLVRDDLAVGASDTMLFAARHLQHDAIADADPGVGFRYDDPALIAWAEPLPQRFGVDPRKVDLFDRCRVVTFEREAWLLDTGFLDVGHGSLSK